MRGHTWHIVDALISVSCETDVVNKKADRDIRSKGPCQPETIGSSYLLRTLIPMVTLAKSIKGSANFTSNQKLFWN